jgi:hypothetical protein
MLKNNRQNEDGHGKVVTMLAKDNLCVFLEQ